MPSAKSVVLRKWDQLQGREEPPSDMIRLTQGEAASCRLLPQARGRPARLGAARQAGPEGAA